MQVPSNSDFAAPGDAHWVSLRYFCITRLAISCLLLIALAVSDEHWNLGEQEPVIFLRTILIYVPLSAALLALAIYQPRRFYMQLAVQLVLDLCVLTILMYSSGGPRSGLAALYLLPVAGAAILSPAPLALFFAALSSLAILGESVWRELTLSVGTVSFVQAGLYGASSFALAIVMNQLAARLISQERIARQRGQDLRSQIEINRTVVADMHDGVLILSFDGQPRSFNPAAARLLQIDDPADFVQHGWGKHRAGTEISKHFLEWRAAPSTHPAVVEVILSPEVTPRVNQPMQQDLRLRVRFVASPTHPFADGDFVVFLEDLLRVEERAQQLKLASMGRLTASIAHEIRNPLAAISHAAALMAEGDAGPGSARLLRIVQDNTLRLNRIVENILQLSRRAAVERESIDVSIYLAQLVGEFCREQGCPDASIDFSVHGKLVVHFNAEHLRAALFNLLQNAQRHASGSPGSISVIVVPVGWGITRNHPGGLDEAGERIEFIVQDDGADISRDARQQLFEPFFTTHTRGTGLGLYLARELCLANGATLNYVPNADEKKKGGFVINASGSLHPINPT